VRDQGAELRREVGFFGTLSLSVGVLAPTLAMSVTGVEPARLLGRAAPLAFVLAALGVGLVAYGFVRLAGEYSHAGSVYAFAGNTLGPRAGFVCGWALMGTYIVFPPVSILGVATFGQAFLESTGIASDPPWLPLALGAWALIGLLASRDIRVATRSLLGLELASVALILALVIVIYLKLAAGDVPRGQTLNADFLDVPPGVSLSTVALAGTFGFLSFAGFEAAGSLGEESQRPRRAIPRSIVTAVAFAAVFYLVTMVAQTLGFGTDAAGAKAFAGSQAPLGDLGKAYVGTWMADLLDLGAMLSALGAGLGGMAVGARMLFALSRDGLLAGRLAGVAASTGAPTRALAANMTLTLTALLAFGIAGTPALKAFFYLATIGVLSLLVMYMVTNVAAIRLLAGRGRRRWEALLPALGIGIAAYVLYRNVYPVPAAPFDVFPYVVAAWLLVGLVVAVAVPGLARRMGERLAARV
jgi:amino acid transporter